MNGLDSSTLSECLFTKIIQAIKKETTQHEAMLENEGYKFISEFPLVNPKEPKEHLKALREHYIINLKYHHESIAASNRQLLLTEGCTY